MTMAEEIEKTLYKQMPKFLSNPLPLVLETRTLNITPQK